MIQVQLFCIRGFIIICQKTRFWRLGPFVSYFQDFKPPFKTKETYILWKFHTVLTPQQSRKPVVIRIVDLSYKQQLSKLSAAINSFEIEWIDAADRPRWIEVSGSHEHREIHERRFCRRFYGPCTGANSRYVYVRLRRRWKIDRKHDRRKDCRLAVLLRSGPLGVRTAKETESIRRRILSPLHVDVSSIDGRAIDRLDTLVIKYWEGQQHWQPWKESSFCELLVWGSSFDAFIVFSKDCFEDDIFDEIFLLSDFAFFLEFRFCNFAVFFFSGIPRG